MAVMPDSNYYDDESDSDTDYAMTIDDCVSYLTEILTGIKEIQSRFE